MIDLVPTTTRVIIEKEDVPEKVGSIYIPSTSKEFEPTEGIVVACGDKCEYVSIGDRVFFGRYSGFTFDRHGKKYVLCNEEDILAIIRSDDLHKSNGG